jgi:hypothetical protein
MPVTPVSCMQWKVLRAVNRGDRPVLGLNLRLAHTGLAANVALLNGLVKLGLLVRTSGTDCEPFEASYQLTELGEHAAEYGEYDGRELDRSDLG